MSKRKVPAPAPALATGPLPLTGLPQPERQVTALTQIKHPSKRRRS